jgi:TonB family protein
VFGGFSMTQTFHSALLSFFVLVGAPLVMAQSGAPNSRIQQSAEARPESWQRFVSNEGRFAVFFPGTPTVSEEVVDHPGVRFVLRKTQLRTFAEYGVMYADYPKSITDNTSADVLLDEGAKGAVAEVNSQLLSISPISVGGYPGRFLKERMPNGTIMQVKIILVGQRMYQVAITTPKEDGADPATVGFHNSIASKFLDSFQLNNIKQDSALDITCPPDVQNCVAVKESVLCGRAISLPKPSYPPIARAAHATGPVDVRILVDEQGIVVAAASVNGHPLLQAAAVAAARQARFTPRVVDNKPVKVASVIRYNFEFAQ